MVQIPIFSGRKFSARSHFFAVAAAAQAGGGGAVVRLFVVEVVESLFNAVRSVGQCHKAFVV